MTIPETKINDGETIKMPKLYFRYGAMGSSKSANILMVRYNYEERGQYAVLLKSRTDNRDGEREIKSRMGLSAPAEYVDDFIKEISENWKPEHEEHLYHGKKWMQFWWMRRNSFPRGKSISCQISLIFMEFRFSAMVCGQTF